MARARGFTVCLAAVWFIAACQKEAPKLEPEPAGSATEAPPAEPHAEYRESNFDLTIRPASAFAAGKPGVVEIQLEAKGGYHMNETYPYRFKPRDSAGVKFGAPTYTREAMQFEPARGTMKLEVTPESAGAKSVSGLFLFSVCSADRCLVEKRELRADLLVD